MVEDKRARIISKKVKFEVFIPDESYVDFVREYQSGKLTEKNGGQSSKYHYPIGNPNWVIGGCKLTLEMYEKEARLFRRGFVKFCEEFNVPFKNPKRKKQEVTNG